jgi:putative DNA primase/helicase
LITKLVPVPYQRDARAPTGERVLGDICMGQADVAEFLQRWFGYCLTGEVTEQCFVVHWGEGSNGKSTVLGLMAETMGDYASTAAPGLMTASKGERHPTEIAAIMGRRMVTAHESAAGVMLREDFVKQATGGDRLTARFMREDFFEFPPTHKLQLLTNHKPQIQGQDPGIWRRVLLVPYLASFGSAEQVRAGTHTHEIDRDLMVALRAEMAGILAWRVRGAMAWAAAGLQAPTAVRAAVEAYRLEQDRIGQFVGECCETGPDLAEPLTEGLGGLYPAYVTWCREGGVFPVSKSRFRDDVVRVVGGRIEERKILQGDGRRRDVRMVMGVRLLPE